MNFLVVKKISAVIVVLIVIFGGFYAFKNKETLPVAENNTYQENQTVQNTSNEPTKEFNIFGNNESLYYKSNLFSENNFIDQEQIKNPDTVRTTTNTETKIEKELSVKNYGNKIVDIIKKFTEATDEVTIFNDIVKNKTSTEKLSVVKNAYEMISVSIKALKTPQDVATFNENLISNYENHANEIQKLIDSKTIEQVGTTLWTSYTNSVTEIQKTLVNLAKFFKSQEITFQPSESGYFFTQIAQ